MTRQLVILFLIENINNQTSNKLLLPVPNPSPSIT